VGTEAYLFFFSGDRAGWEDLESHPTWDDDYEYRRKINYVTINGFFLPEPEKVPPCYGDIYYVPTDDLDKPVLAWCWEHERQDFLFLKKGLVHLQKDHAIEHHKALILKKG